MENMKHNHCGAMKIGKILIIIGAINWGLIGVGALMGQNWNVVNMVIGSWPKIEAIVYILVGIAGVMKIFGCKCKTCGSCQTCQAGGAAQKMM